MFFERSNRCLTDIQDSLKNIIITLTRDNINPLLTKTTPHIGEGLVRDEQTNELYLPLTSTVVLKHKKEKSCVPLDFKSSLNTDAPVDLGT